MPDILVEGKLVTCGVCGVPAVCAIVAGHQLHLVERYLCRAHGIQTWGRWLAGQLYCPLCHFSDRDWADLEPMAGAELVILDNETWGESAAVPPQRLVPWEDALEEALRAAEGLAP